ncbi:MAG: hypothetical protein ACK4FM_02560 [Caldimicrobium sp.]
MQGKVYTIKPDIIYKKQVSKAVSKERVENEVSLKERIIDRLESVLLLILSVIFLVASVGVAYKSLILIKIKSEKRKHLLEQAQLQEQLKVLTSREVVLEKAKKLGLKPPSEKDYIILK